MTDYFVVRARTLDIDSLYRSGSKSIYYYQVRLAMQRSRSSCSAAMPPMLVRQCCVL